MVVVRSDLTGLTIKMIDKFINKKAQKDILVGLLGSKPCIVAVNTNLLDKFFPDIHLFYNNIRQEWPCLDLVHSELKLLDNAADINAFNQEVQNTLRQNAIDMEVYLQDPSTTYLSYDTKFGRGVIIEPNVYFGANVKLHDNVRIRAFSYLEGVEIESGAEIGPFARIRGNNSKIGTKAKIGNFVEIKSSELGSGTKVSHLSYIGDAKIGKSVNVGAGVITCNYDGFKKHVTVVGNNSFIGSNSSLIAPVTIGTNSLIGAGSFINKDVPDYTFAKGRAEQIMKPNKRK
jgi:bifunctional UDP-N-acetylglucosamine pyrophosphorylase/glucosamine-1-phosphate N-acetyltransferase